MTDRDYARFPNLSWRSPLWIERVRTFVSTTTIAHAARVRAIILRHVSGLFLAARELMACCFFFGTRGSSAAWADACPTPQPYQNACVIDARSLF